MSCALEKGFENRVKKLIIKKGGWVQKIHGNEFVQGVPDLLCCYRGIFIAIECKSPEGEGSKLQKHNIRLIKQAGGYAVFARTMKPVLDILKEIDANQEKA